MNGTWKGYGCILAAGCLWGTNGLFVKLMQECGSSSAYTGFVRIVLSFLILVVITLIKEGPKAFKISRNTLISCVMLGLVCQAVYNYVYSSAINSLGVSFACVMTYMSPAFAGVISYFLFGSIFLGLFGHPWTTVTNPIEPGILLYGFIYVLIPTGICYIIYFSGVRRIKGSSKVPVAASVENIVAVVIGVLVFHEKVGMANAAGIALVLCSIAVMNLEFPAGRKRKTGIRFGTHRHAAV